MGVRVCVRVHVRVSVLMILCVCRWMHVGKVAYEGQGCSLGTAYFVFKMHACVFVCVCIDEQKDILNI